MTGEGFAIQGVGYERLGRQRFFAREAATELLKGSSQKPARSGQGIVVPLSLSDAMIEP